MTEIMTSGTGAGDLDSGALFDPRSTSGQSLSSTAAVLLVTVLGWQCAGLTELAAPNHTAKLTDSTIQLPAAGAQMNLFGDLLEFRKALASSQRDLPEEAARLLRENLWQLYG